MPRYCFRVIVTLNDDVLDPAGLAIAQSLKGHTIASSIDAQSVRLGRVIDLAINSDDHAVAQQQLDDLCQTLLHNPTIEQYSIVTLSSQ